MIAVRAIPVDPPCQINRQRRLAAFNRQRLQPGGDGDWRQQLRHESALRRSEAAFVEGERTAVADAAAAAPVSADAFVSWFADLRLSGPGQGDALFPWLAEQATLAQMRWFIAQEAGGEAGFDDLVAMTQVKLPPRAKLELARNYWDEVGRGDAEATHGGMLDSLLEDLGLTGLQVASHWEPLALGNLMVALAVNRRYAWHSLGALGVIELTAPGRVELVDRGLKRLGLPARSRRYFTVHASLDVRHAAAWIGEVLHPLVAATPSLARFLAEGALMRLEAGRRCFARYRAELGVDAVSAGVSPPA